MKNIVIFGSGGHAKVVADIIEKEQKFKITGLIDISNMRGFWEYQLIGRDLDLIRLTEIYDIYGGIVAIGDNLTRFRVVERILRLKKDFVFINAIHPSAQFGKNVTIGQGTVVAAGVAINCDTVIGKHCIINTNSSIDHDNIISDFCSIAPNASTGGNVEIGPHTSISLGANVIHNITIGESTVIGAGAIVVSNIDSNIIAYGIPAKKIRVVNEEPDAKVASGY